MVALRGMFTLTAVNREHKIIRIPRVALRCIFTPQTYSCHICIWGGVSFTGILNPMWVRFKFRETPTASPCLCSPGGTGCLVFLSLRYLSKVWILWKSGTELLKISPSHSSFYLLEHCGKDSCNAKTVMLFQQRIKRNGALFSRIHGWTEVNFWSLALNLMFLILCVYRKTHSYLSLVSPASLKS